MQLCHIGYTRTYYANLREVFLITVKEMTRKEAEHVIHPETAQRLNAKPSTTHQYLRYAVNNLRGGIFDSWETWHTELGDKRESVGFMFVQEAFFIWPLICGCQCVAELDDDEEFNDIFKGTAAKSFRKLVTDFGFNDTNYPYYPSGAKVLKVWKGANWTKHYIGNNLPVNDAVDNRPRKYKRVTTRRSE